MIYMNPSVSILFPQSQPFSVQVKSPQARFTDHHKQDFSFLDPGLNRKALQFTPYNILRL